MNINTTFTLEEIQKAFNYRYILNSQQILKTYDSSIGLEVGKFTKFTEYFFSKKSLEARDFLLQFLAFYIWNNIYTLYKIPKNIDETLTNLSYKINTFGCINANIFQKYINDNEQVINEFITWLKDTFTFNSNKVCIAGMSLGYSEVFPLKIDNTESNGIFIFKTQANPENINWNNIKQKFNSDMEDVIQLCSLQDKTFCAVNIFIDNFGCPVKVLKYNPCCYHVL